MSGPFRLSPDELGATEGTELDDAVEAIAALELLGDDLPVRTGPAFTDRVMTAIADEPSPAAVGFLLPLRRRVSLEGFAESFRQAWVSVGAGRPAFARAAALAYVLVVAIAGTSVLGAATFGAAGALGLLGPHESVQPSPEPTIQPSVTPAPTLVAPTPSPAVSPEPSESPEAEPSDDHGGGSGPEPSDDHGGNSGPGGGSDDGSGSDGSSGSEGSSGPSGTDHHSGSDGTSGGGGSLDD